MKTTSLFAAVILTVTASAVVLGRRYTDYSKVESTEDKIKPRYVDYFGVDTADDEAADEKLKPRYIDYFGVDTADTGAAGEKLKPRYIE